MSVKIGVIAPLTGPSSAIGDEITRTLNILSEELSNSEKKLAISFIFEDGKAGVDSSPTTAVQKLISSDGVRLFIVATSGEIMQIGALANKLDLLMFAPYATVPSVKTLGERVFRTAIDVERAADLLAKYLQNSSALPIAIITEQHAFTIGASEQLRLRLQGKIVADENYPLDETDLRPVLLRARSKNPKAYYLSCARPNTCALITNQARQIGIKEQLYSFLHMSDPDFLEASYPNSDGIIFLSPPEEQSSSPRFREFQSRYQKRYPDGSKNEFLMRSTYDAAMGIVDGVEEVGPRPLEISRYLQNYEVQGALGEVSFDENGDIRNLDYTLRVIRGGKIISLRQ